MPELFELSFLNPQIKSYDPLKESYAAGETCRTCNSKVIHNESISVCGCYRYCHQKCLIQQMNNRNPENNQFQYECKTCKRKIDIFYTMQLELKPHFCKNNIILIIFSLLAIPLSIRSILSSSKNIAQQLALTFALFIFFATLVIGIINCFVIRRYKLEDLKSTNMGLMISAFENLEKQIQEQTTQTQMVR